MRGKRRFCNNYKIAFKCRNKSKNRSAKMAHIEEVIREMDGLKLLNTIQRPSPVSPCNSLVSPTPDPHNEPESNSQSHRPDPPEAPPTKIARLCPDLQNENPTSSPGNPVRTAPSIDTGPQENALCTKCKIDNPRMKMITCSQCKNQFHRACAGVNTEQADLFKNFLCPDCQKITYRHHEPAIEEA